MAVLDGIQNKITPGYPLDKDIYDLAPEELAVVPKTPGSLDEALSCLEDDHGFLMRGDVFTEELIETFIDYKRKNEAEAVRHLLLCDLPDFDSLLTGHREQVVQFLEHLDILVWTTTPEKYADERFYAFLREVPKARHFSK